MNRIIILMAALLICSLHCQNKKTTLAILPYAPFSNKLIHTVKEGIQKTYNIEVTVLSSMELPSHAIYKPKKRYRAEILLDHLDLVVPGDYTKILGLTSKDISTTKGKIYDWGIFGLGSVDGRPCVVSTFRLRSGRASEKKFHQRFIKVVNHELGHTFGLSHCPSKGCLMQDAKGTIKTVDNESGELCDECQKFLGELLKT